MWVLYFSRNKFWSFNEEVTLLINLKEIMNYE